MSETAQSNVPTETILYYTHELSRSKRRCDEANSAHRLLVKRAKGDGVPTEAVLESIAWARLEPEERARRIIDRIRVESARYPTQAPMLAERVARMDTHVSEKMRQTDTLFEAEQRGYQAGLKGVPVEENPYPGGSEQAQTWRIYWGNGQAANAMQLGDNARQASTRREKTPRKASAEVSLPLGDTPAPRKRARKPPRKRGVAKRRPATRASGGNGQGQPDAAA